LPTEQTLTRAAGASSGRVSLPGFVTWSLALAAGLLLATAAEGPDFGHYTDWAAAVLSGDIFTLRGNVLSPGGVPFTLAAAGPGLLFAVTKAALLPFTLGAAALLAGWIAALVFWWSSFLVLRRVSDGHDWLAMFGAAALFIGTHAGLYSHVYATEVFANALIAALWALALTRRPWRLADSLAVGALTGLLLLVRAHVVLYAVPAVWVAVFGDDSPRIDRERITTMLSRLAAVALPGAIAVTQYAVVNAWMTGSPLQPPYVYGGAGFSSVDLRHPEVAAVLVHPWHGLLSYHPLYGVAFIAVANLAIRAQRWRPLWIATLLAAIAHVWVQAGWYIWWLGGSTFGMRGMAPAALPLTAGVIAVIAGSAGRQPARAWWWAGVTVLACAWSYPLLLRGYTDFFTRDELFAAQHAAVLSIGVAIVVLLYVRLSRPSARAALDVTIRSAAVTGLVASLAYLAWHLRLVPAPGVRIAVGLAVAVLALVAARWWASTDRSRTYGHRASTWLAAAAVAIFAAQAVLFTRLAVRTERVVTSGAPPPREFEYHGASPVDELRVTYAEYLHVPGFQARKAAFRRFLAWQWVAVSTMSPDERRLAEAITQRLVPDPGFGEGLIQVTVHDGVARISGSGISDGQQSRARALVLAIPGVQSVSFEPD
jgi:BON domain-containing protein